MKYFFCTLLFIFFAFTAKTSFAAELKTDVQLEIALLETMTKETMASNFMGAISSQNGNIFFIGRHPKTKKLKWHLYNPFAKKIISEGDCPFVEFTASNISANSGFALAYGKYPNALWSLNLETKNWENLYQNPGRGKEGLAITPISPFSFVNDTTAYSLLDLWDKEHFVLDTMIVAFGANQSKTDTVASLWKFKNEAVKIITGKDLKNPSYLTDFMRFGENNSFLCVVKNKPQAEDKGFKAHLFLSTPSEFCKKIDEASGRILPMDIVSPSKMLYAADLGPTGKTFLFEDGKKTPVLVGPNAMAGKIFKNGKIGLYTRERGSFAIYIGTPQKMKKVMTFAKPYGAIFIEEINKFVVVKDKTISYYNL